MNKHIIGLTLLIVLALFIGRLYLKTWERKKNVEHFIEKENSNSSSLKENFQNEEGDIENNVDNLKLKSKLIKIKSKNNKKFNVLSPLVSVKVSSKLSANPQIVNTHKNNLKHIFVQDNKFNLYFLNEKGKLIWKKYFKEEIKTKIFEIDYFKNRKIQYLFATDSLIYLIDYNGNRVGYYPKKTKSYNLIFLNILDYSKNKNYRIAITSKKGDLYLFNKHFHPLAGWAPKKLNDSIGNYIQKLIHIRCKNKDYLITATKVGEIYLVKRNGSIYKKIVIGDKIKNFTVIKTGKSSYKLVVLCQSDILYEYDIEGYKKLTLKPLSQEKSEITLLKDLFKNANYLLLKKSATKIAIIDKDGKNILMKNISADNVKVQYLYVKNNYYISIFNYNTKEISIYKNNKIINKLPIISNSNYSLVYYGGNIKIVNCNEDNLELFNFKI